MSSAGAPAAPTGPLPVPRDGVTAARARAQRLACAGHVQALAAITALGAGLRFATLHLQGYWYDEAVTVVRVLHPRLVDTLAAVRHGESTPPLYYVLAWPWSRAFGTGEVGLRSLSALIGTLTIPVVYAAAARLVSRRAGLIAAGLAAVSPLLVWYSQEARAYALAMLLVAASLLAFAYARERLARGPLAAWAVLSALALASHYFAIFPVAAETVWLAAVAWRGRDGVGAARRRTGVAIAAVAAAGVALAPLAIHQAGNGRTAWIASYGLVGRLLAIPRTFSAGPTAFRELALSAPALLLMGLGVGLLVLASVRELRGVSTAAIVGLSAIVGPLALLVVGPDYLIARNSAVVWPVLLIVVAAGFAVRGGRPRPWLGRAGVGGAAVLAALSLGLTLAVDLVPRLQRGNWRGAAAVLSAGPERAIIVPALGTVPLEHYTPGTWKQGTRPLAVREIDVVSWSLPGGGWQPAPGFRLLSARRTGNVASARYVSARPRLVTRAALLRGAVAGDVLLRSPAGRR